MRVLNSVDWFSTPSYFHYALQSRRTPFWWNHRYLLGVFPEFSVSIYNGGPDTSSVSPDEPIFCRFGNTFVPAQNYFSNWVFNCISPPSMYPGKKCRHQGSSVSQGLWIFRSHGTRSISVMLEVSNTEVLHELIPSLPGNPLKSLKISSQLELDLLTQISPLQGSTWARIPLHCGVCLMQPQMSPSHHSNHKHLIFMVIK